MLCEVFQQEQTCVVSRVHERKLVYMNDQVIVVNKMDMTALTGGMSVITEPVVSTTMIREQDARRYLILSPGVNEKLSKRQDSLTLVSTSPLSL